MDALLYCKKERRDAGLFANEIGKALVVIGITALVYLMLLLFRRRKKSLYWQTELPRFLLACYLSAVFAVLLMPIVHMGISDSEGFFFYMTLPGYALRHNFRPLSTIALQWAQLRNGDLRGSVNLLMNSTLFLPFPILLKFSFPKQRIRFCFLIAFASILFCEIAQYFLGRITDVDDVLLNTISVLLGIALLRLIFQTKKKSKI